MTAFDHQANAARTGAVHAAEGPYAPDGKPVLALMAEEGIRAGATAPTLLPSSPRDPGARGEELHPKLCPTSGGSFNLPHAGVHTVQAHAPNPRALDHAALRALLRRAFDGAATAA